MIDDDWAFFRAVTMKPFEPTGFFAVIYAFVKVVDKDHFQATPLFVRTRLRSTNLLDRLDTLFSLGLGHGNAGGVSGSVRLLSLSALLWDSEHYFFFFAVLFVSDSYLVDGDEVLVMMAD